MFHMMRNMMNSGTHGARSAVETVRKRLPRGWSVQLRPGSSGRGDQLTLQGTDGRRAKLTIVSRRRVSPKEVAHLVHQAQDAERLLLVAPFLSPRTRALLADADTSYVDATGNLRLVASDPAIFIEGRGADQDPDREPRALRSLKGAAAGRVVRALCDFMPPYGVRTLAASSSTPLGTVSRVISFLEEEALITRNESKAITAVDRPALLARWASDYSLTGSNILHSYLEPRGLAALVPKLAKLDRYAVTGTLAGPGIAAARLATIFVDDADRAAETLEIVPADAGANVWLLEPYDEVVFDRTQPLHYALARQAVNVVAAAPSQVVADLMTSPGRGPQEAEALLNKMKAAGMPGERNPEPEYIAARRVLLDSLEALGAHRKAIVLVGAQAIYLRVGEGDLAVSPYTTDGDLAIDPRELDDKPELAGMLKAAGFKLTRRPGT
jgi:hypothetical protein